MKTTRLFAKWLCGLPNKIVPKYVPAETLFESWERKDRRSYLGSTVSCVGFGVFLINLGMGDISTLTTLIILLSLIVFPWMGTFLWNGYRIRQDLAHIDRKVNWYNLSHGHPKAVFTRESFKYDATPSYRDAA